ncbi:hypothetical protein HCA00_04610 [Listeria booriae]|uniref:Uncharacterized protein n=1 Tax=Listeria booriae TaxID=1552123 RepID=A0A842FU25_9LIST|nr:hypothetical protein [Listeria booriae]MBC2285753.1 hypothetical protein [Listeria booriae]MBC6128064.1 hypothetical protein [Listeria booriae]
MDDIVQEVLDALIKNDRVFYILFLAFLLIGLWVGFVLFKRMLKQSEKAEERAESKQAIIESQQNFISEMRIEHQEHLRNMQIELSKSQTINEKLVEVTSQQQRYIESLKSHRILVENMDKKIDSIRLNLATKGGV